LRYEKHHSKPTPPKPTTALVTDLLLLQVLFNCCSTKVKIAFCIKMYAAYQIKLPRFEGPFDLLLYFIERDELDIYDIPIARLTDEFLNYLHTLQLLNIDLAGDFMLMAATLMRIKAKMLLPRKDLNPAGEEIDPRAELVEKLIEYRSFKEAIVDIQQLENNRALRSERGNTSDELTYIAEKYSTDAEMESLTLFKLLSVFQKVLRRLESRDQKVEVKMQQLPYTIAQEREQIATQLQAQKRLSFDDLFANCVDRYQAIVRFLAILELVQEQYLQLKGGEICNSFWLLPIEPATNNSPT
jgi:segregation and condensation protein A